MPEEKIAVIGLGYVGLPLAVTFSRKFPVTGYDINADRIDELRYGVDHTGEVDAEHLGQASLTFTNRPEDLKNSTTYILAVPTPIDAYKKPDIRLLLDACTTVSQVLKKGDLVVIESTVYPGCTEEDCIPVLEQGSGLQAGIDFGVGYSPERINPGDTVHRLENITKVVSGLTAADRERTATLYAQVVEAGIYEAESIQVAEMAKVIENCQRDLNIAFVNELALICQKAGLDTGAVLDAAGTKWNFLPFRPGLVGGHCIGVDPYYLTHKAQQLGYDPRVILAGRDINDHMGRRIAERGLNELVRRKMDLKQASVLILGFTFKENCPDIRNTRVIDMVRYFEELALPVTVVDPLARQEEAERYYGIRLEQKIPSQTFSLIVAAVAHRAFARIQPEKYLQPGGAVIDVKHIFTRKKEYLRV